MADVSQNGDAAGNDILPSGPFFTVFLGAFVLAIALSTQGVLPVWLMPIVVLGPLELARRLPRFSLVVHFGMPKALLLFSGILAAGAVAVSL